MSLTVHSALAAGLIFFGSSSLAQEFTEPTGSPPPLEANAPAATRQIHARAAAGDANAQGLIGQWYYLGEGLPRDLGKAIYWGREAYGAVRTLDVFMALHCALLETNVPKLVIEGGQAFAAASYEDPQFLLQRAKVFRLGRGVPTDADIARLLTDEARVALRARVDFDRPLDWDSNLEAIPYYITETMRAPYCAGAATDRRAIQAEDPDAVQWRGAAPPRPHMTLGGIGPAAFEEISGAPPPLEAAASQQMRAFYQRAVAGDSRAQARIGKAYFDGFRLPGNLAKAIYWLRLAHRTEKTTPVGMNLQCALIQTRIPDLVAEGGAAIAGYEDDIHSTGTERAKVYRFGIGVRKNGALADTILRELVARDGLSHLAPAGVPSFLKTQLRHANCAGPDLATVGRLEEIVGKAGKKQEPVPEFKPRLLPYGAEHRD